ncbi:hypothetical protein [Candidatus Methylomicrobium oryzae]|uniref:hypothetical protein n=1 Tax=Candidatus Methylomicrobium oryzae TaxID=2802053 RepID=UPI001921B770|nr:hypothetical protein [Methylomicrobium sp. RS1]MBL1265002.1 hypothetical protein [Methylomicrobium sp. RS1]
MIATRYSLPVIVLFTVALIPTVIHNYMGLTAKDNFSVNRIPVILDSFSSNPSKRLESWGKETFDCHDWIERIYTDDDGHVIRLFAGKSFDHKRLYHHPELALSYGNSMEKENIQLLEGTKIPVNVLRNINSPGLAAYVLWSDGQFIENPIQHQIKDTLKLLISPKKPMTLFYVSDNYSTRETPFEKTHAAKILTQAIQSIIKNNIAIHQVIDNK